MSNGSYVLNIQKFNDRADSNTNSIPVPCGTVCRHIKPCCLSRASSATSTTTMCEISPYVIINSIVGNRSRLIPSPQSSLSTNRISSNGFGVGEGVSVGSGVGVKVGIAVGSGEFVAVGVLELAGFEVGVAVSVGTTVSVGVTSLRSSTDAELNAVRVGVSVGVAVNGATTGGVAPNAFVAVGWWVGDGTFVAVAEAVGA